MTPPPPPTLLLPCLLSLLLLSLSSASFSSSSPATVCIVGSGISGSSLAHFLRKYSPEPSLVGTIRMFEKNAVVGGRMATVTIANETFEAGASVIHPLNYHLSNFTSLLELRRRIGDDDDDASIGIWNGEKFLFKTLNLNWDFPLVKFSLVKKIVSLVNAVKLFWRYGFSLLRMQRFVEASLNNFLKYYESFGARPVFGRVEDMLNWSGLYNLTRRSLKDELVDAGLSSLLVQELVTVITRINYGQSTSMSGLAGAVSLAGSGGGLWSVEGGNWQIAAGLISSSNVELHLDEEICSVSHYGTYYELNSTKRSSYQCHVTVFATPLDELDIKYHPPISIPERKLQHTHTTFVRGLLNPAYFGMGTITEVPELVGTVEDPNIPFSCVSVLKKHGKGDITYKLFSRKPLDDNLLDQMFSIRKETIRIDWAAYPHYEPPEIFAPFMLDDWHLYYINTFESAASAMETGAVSAENMARLILSRVSAGVYSHISSKESSGFGGCKEDLHKDS